MPILTTKSSPTQSSVEKGKDNSDSGLQSLPSHVIAITAKRDFLSKTEEISALPNISQYQLKSAEVGAHLRNLPPSTHRQVLSVPRPTNVLNNDKHNPSQSSSVPEASGFYANQSHQPTIQPPAGSDDNKKIQQRIQAVEAHQGISPTSYQRSPHRQQEQVINPPLTSQNPLSMFPPLTVSTPSVTSFHTVAIESNQDSKPYSKKSYPLSKKRKDPGTHIKAPNVPTTNVATAINANDGTAVKPPLPLTEKKLRRLERNRLSARECRRRKREAAETMLHEINILEAENVQLRLQLQIGYEAECSVNDEQQKLTLEIDTLLKSGEASEADIHNTLEEFKEKYADYGQSRRSSIEFHLRNIARLLMPTQTTSVVMHAFNNSSTAAASVFSAMPSTTITTTNEDSTTSLPTNHVKSTNEPFKSNDINESSCTTTNPIEASTDEDCNEKSSVEIVKPISTSVSEGESNYGEQAQALQEPAFDPRKLFSFLVKYLQVTPEQAIALKDSRFVAQEMDSCLDEAFKVLSQLRERLTKTGDDLDKEFNNVRSILSPTQAAKFLVWVANNAACMHMLNELWDRVYPSS